MGNRRRNLRGKLELTWMGKDQALIPTIDNTYDYTWVDKNDPRVSQTHYLIHQDHIGDPADGGIHDNLMILGDSGDVLEALTRVPELSENYVGQVKCIYIDPPFNTEKTFDSFEDNLEHSVWLTFMRDRLVLMERLLSDNGSIWVHLDEVQIHRMRVLLDEVFGPENFISQISWEKVSGRDNRSTFSKTCDFILVYAKTKDGFANERNLLPRTAAQTSSAYTNPDNDPRGPWTSGDFTAQYNPAENERLDQIYTLETPAGNKFEPSGGRVWLYTKKRYLELLKDNRLWFGENGGNIPRVKRFLSEVQDGLVPKTLWTAQEVGTNDSGKKETKDLFPGVSPFSTPKPEKLIERILTIATNPGDIVMDFFGGSGTTAAVAHKMGRRWVTVELQQDNFETYTKPRLQKVVNNEDSGGVTTKTERVPADGIELPDRVAPEEAQEFSTMLGRFEDEITMDLDLSKTLASSVRKAAKNDELPLDAEEMKQLLRLLRKLGTQTQNLAPEAMKQLRRAARTKNHTEEQWTGGGGFTLATLSPNWVDVMVDDFTGDLVPMLTETATGEVLRRSVAAHLRYSVLEGSVFAGIKGRKYLAVVEGMVTENIVDEMLLDLPKGGAITLVCYAADEGVHRYLNKRAPGSTVLTMPDDLFNFSATIKDL